MHCGVFGPTGAVGSEVVQCLLRAPKLCERLTLFSRRVIPTPVASADHGYQTQTQTQTETETDTINETKNENEKSNRVSVEVIDFENEAFEKTLTTLLASVECVFYCLGSTIKKAGSQKAFEHIDLGYLTAVSGAAKKAGVKSFALCSSNGANKTSWAPYLRVKGLGEQAVKDQKFLKTVIAQPGLILTKRDETRPMEFALQKTAAVFDPFKWFSVSAASIAHALVAETLLADSEAKPPTSETPMSEGHGEGEGQVVVLSQKAIVAKSKQPLYSASSAPAGGVEQTVTDGSEANGKAKGTSDSGVAADLKAATKTEEKAETKIETERSETKVETNPKGSAMAHPSSPAETTPVNQPQ